MGVETMTVTRNESGKFDSFAWPGGYPLFYLCADNGVLCPDCANENGHDDATDKQWRIVASDVNWEDSDLTCDHCNRKIESAYGD